MQYLFCFLEGVVTFISPCMLPMLPVYLLYFAGGEEGRKRTLKNALGFVAGFSLVFLAMGAFAGSIGMLLTRYSRWVNLLAGAAIVLLGLHYMGALRLPALRKQPGPRIAPERLKKMRFITSVLFGLVFALGWTPCVGVFLSSALLLAASAGHSLAGVALLGCYALGLGLPFVASALLMDELGQVFSFIKKHYRQVNLASGILLVLLGVGVMAGLLERLQGLVSFV